MKKRIYLSIICILMVVCIGNFAFALSNNGPFITDLIAGQQYDIGQVIVWNDSDFLYVKYEIDIAWVGLLETHLHVAVDLEDIPQQNGNPIPGSFEYQTVHTRLEQEYTYEVPMKPEWVNGTELFIAAHASVESQCGQTETCWCLGTPFEGPDSWGMYIIYTVELPPKMRASLISNRLFNLLTKFFFFK